MITLEHVNKYFSKGKKNEIHVINDTSLKLKDTGLVALLGPSGSGKTTLLNVIGGLDRIKKGKIYVNKERISKRRSSNIDKIRNLNMGYIFQDYKLIDDLSVFDNVALVLKMIGIKDQNEIKTRVNYVLETLNIYRYRNRPAGMLSGGERQRVGIARAIVKDPDIILADEPTGNLDSKNSLELMNIIKCISKNRLVILVTHEEQLAKFFASRIIEVRDGEIVNDYENESSDKLDYRLENNIYLKDIKRHNEFSNSKEKINIYNEEEDKLDIDIVIRHGNIYIKTNDNSKIEVVDNNSSIEFIDDHYKKIDKDAISKYEFNFDKVINNNFKKKYSSILNPISLIRNGFKKVFNYTFIKKLLLLGFMASAMFIILSFSRIFASLKVDEKDYITCDKSYLTVKANKFKVEDYLSYEKLEGVNYIIPSNSNIEFTMKLDNFYQTTNAQIYLTGSLASTSLLTKDKLKVGNMPTNDKEIVVDTMALDSIFTDNKDAVQAGYLLKDDMIGKEVYINNLTTFKIVGISDTSSPSIFANPSILNNITSISNEDETNYIDYLVKDGWTLKKGKLPLNDYEILVNYKEKDMYPLNKTINTKVNNNKLKVTGYYETKEEYNKYLTSSNTVKYNKILNTQDIMISSNNKEETINDFHKLDINVKNPYEESKSNYEKSNQKELKRVLTISAIMIGISLIEMFLMMRSSFLSRIKEIGTYRAIGVKKRDIYKMFLGEIIAITFTGSLAGIIIMGYILYNLSKMPIVGSMFILNPLVVILSLGLCLIFNILVGLIPVANVIRHTPAEILARHDI